MVSNFLKTQNGESTQKGKLRRADWLRHHHSRLDKTRRDLDELEELQRLSGAAASLR